MADQANRPPGAPQRDALGRLLPGSTANPGGIPKAVLAIKEALAGDGPAARTRLIELMGQSDDLPVAFQAARTILAYAAGQPPKAPEDQGVDADLVAQIMHAMVTARRPE